MTTEPLRFRIYLEDTDAGGIAYHASYLRFMERARTEWLRAQGLQQSETFGQDVSFVVHSMALRFLRPARLDEVIEVTCDVAKARAASIVFSQRVRLAGEGDDCCAADVTVACISLSSGRARRIPAEILGRARA
ncbi:MAG: tol-pal system-associated acyl-CoA thioesterase [Myxococcales bacterium]|jgi:tol-pal system-associated acyl-CoA thioesterase